MRRSFAATEVGSFFFLPSYLHVFHRCLVTCKNFHPLPSAVLICPSVMLFCSFWVDVGFTYVWFLLTSISVCLFVLPVLFHLGLSPDLQSMEQIRRIMRPTDVPDQGLLCDLLWSDPDKDVLGWGENDRGVSFTFGSEVVAKFLHKHDLDLICRAHQVIAILFSTVNSIVIM